MDKEKINFSSLESVGSQADAGICGPDGCSIEDHRRQVAKNKKKAEDDK
ncbi:hypothetical protein LMB39_10325 [Limosilactobacillus reuteri]|nr:hypothetical protein [Limosilactobacillus reuteri]MCC4328665.1 hypothetical protein [Limosilactobacillus reuteri]MCC4335141.1 hypothetical protein [Limosilactobacillus reuteri]MCC4337947.1 hypothetical protein [Limosilactobacillus reuteri]MCC4349047.1 hypothetical protein [Limosilactobacillus reuteri]MCC4376045.1 hypothetical protein [Limosilactobacillus reuteri]